jgi:hypothetical protein
VEIGKYAFVDNILSAKTVDKNANYTFQRQFDLVDGNAERIVAAAHESVRHRLFF